MKRLLLFLGLLLSLWATPGQAQVPCVGIAGVNTFSIVGTVCPQEPSVTSFAAAGNGIVPAASATDVACLTGVANNVVRLQRIRLTGSAGTAVVVPVTLQYRTAADTGGTPAVTTALPVPYKVDGGTAGGATNASTIAYTANPTIPDTTARPIAVGNLVLTLTGTATGAYAGLVFDWSGSRYEEAPTLRTAAQQVCVNFSAVSVSSGLVGVSFEWTEAAQ